MDKEPLKEGKVKKKKHWMQTPAGKKHIKVMHEARKAKAELRRQQEEKHGSSKEAEAYAFGHCEAWLQTFAERAGVPFKSLARGVGRLLQYDSQR